MSSIQHHVSDSAPGVIGTGLAGSFTIVGFITNSLPVLQAISLLIGIAVGVVTFLYYYRKVKAENAEIQADVAAEKVKATAVLAAEALKAIRDDG